MSEAASPPEHTPKRGVLLINLGTPERCDVASVRRYLATFLSDPAVVRLPTGLGWLNRPLGLTIARFRAPKSAKMYSRIWTERGSPLRTISESQAAELTQALPRGWRAYCAMRYGRPSIPETLRAIETSGIEELIVVPMYPQFSEPTTGTALRQVYEYLKREGCRLQVTTRTSWHDDHGYINAQSELIAQYARSCGLTPDNAYLLFSAHGLPVANVARGDPYPAHVARTATLVGERLGWPTDRMSLAYQSRFGPVEWLKPYTDHVLKDLARTGEERILVCPISFTTDCLETLEELDIRHRALVSEAGAELYLCPALNTFGPFISALKHLVLRGPRPMACAGGALRAPKNEPRITGRQERDVDSLLMVGMSIGGSLGTGEGPNITYTNEGGLRGVKRSQCDVPAILRTLQTQSGLREAWLWNTCQRSELYGWTNGRSDVVDPIRRHLFAGAPDGEVNILTGVEAWHHLLRTAMGLGSGLPGERDVMEQLQAACRLAERAGTAGPLTRHLVQEVSALEARLRKETPWSHYAPEYTHVVLRRIAEESCPDILDRRIVVIGGPTTSASVLRTLRERFGVPGRHLTLLYRGHKRGGHLKILRKAIGNGRRMRVQSYNEPGVLQAIAGADVVVFGVDGEQPVLSAERLCGCRDLSARPLTIFDFNMFASTVGMDKLDGVTLYDARRLEAEVAAFADEMCASSDFARAADAAETWIVQHALWAGGEKCNAPATQVTDDGAALETEPVAAWPDPKRSGVGRRRKRREPRWAVTGSDSS